MSHTTIYFLTQAEDMEEAESQVADFLENEDFFSYYTALPDESGPLTDKRPELMDFIKDWDWKKIADDHLTRAQEDKEIGDLGGYGYHLICAGQLYAQYPTIDILVYNVESDDYRIPADDEGWWLIAVDFSY